MFTKTYPTEWMQKTYLSIVSTEKRDRQSYLLQS